MKHRYIKKLPIGRTRCSDCGHEVTQVVSHYKGGECGAYWHCSHQDENLNSCGARHYHSRAFAAKLFEQFEAKKPGAKPEAKPEVEEVAENASETFLGY